MDIMLDLGRLSKILEIRGQQVIQKLHQIISATDSGLKRLDEQAKELFLELGDDIVLEMFRQVGQGIRKSPAELPVCRCCGKTLRFKQMRPTLGVRTAMTGREKKIPTPYLVCDDCRTGVLWMREVLGLDSDGFTERLRELSIRAGIIEPFESAGEELLNELASVRVSGSKIHSLCQDAGKTAQGLMDEGQLGRARPLDKGEKLYVEVDGGMLHIDGDWHEAKLAMAFPQNSMGPISKDRGAINHRQVCCTLGTRQELGERLFKMVESYLPKTPDGVPVISGNVVVLGDGSPWIKNIVEDVLPGAKFILDWYHVYEHISDTAKVLYKDNDQQRRRWRTIQKNMLKSGRVNAMLDKLRRKCMGLTAGTESQQAVANLYRYLNERKDALLYSEARATGLIIGSGAIESGMGHVLQQRMKRSGMRWGKSGAKAMAALRCAYRSERGIQTVFEKMSKAA